MLRNHALRRRRLRRLDLRQARASLPTLMEQWQLQSDTQRVLAPAGSSRVAGVLGR
jgi:hypothetical protein